MNPEELTGVRESSLEFMRQAGMIGDREPWPFPINDLQPEPIYDLLEPALL
jgi:hypothetical protein